MFYCRQTRFITCVLIIALFPFILSAGEELSFADERLEELVRHEARRPKPSPIYTEDVLWLEELDAEGLGIESIEGIEALKNLRVLNLRNNRIECIEPLSELTKLEDLTVRNNRINDISPLSGLLQLTRLTFRENEVECIEPLRNLPNLEDLSIHSNRVKDITPLENLTLLKELTLRNNRIEDITVLAGLFNLKNVNLRDNRIEDFSPLSELTSIQGPGSRLNLGGNHTTDFRAVEHYYDDIEDVDFIILPPVEEREVKLVINEFMASNGTAFADEDGDYSPWLELYNAGDEPIDLTGWYLSDDADNPLRWQFPDVSETDNPEEAIIEPGKYKVVFTNAERERPYIISEDEINLEKGLVGHWKLNGDAKDSSGNMLHGEIHNVEPATDRFGNEEGALWFDGEDSYVKVPWGKGYDLGEDNLTLSMWVKADEVWKESMVASFGTATDDRRAYAAIYRRSDNRRGQWSFGIDNSGGHSTWQKAVEEWTHVAVKWAKGKATLYINGYSLQEKEYDSYHLLDDLTVGAYGDNRYPFKGKIEDVRIFERALNTSEIHTLAFSGEYHTNFRISRDGEPVILSNPEGEVVDYVSAILLTRNESYARIPNASDTWTRMGGFFGKEYAGASPGLPNQEGILEIEPPEFSHTAGWYTDSFFLELSHPDPDVIILYTLDGSEPCISSLNEEGEEYLINYFFPDEWVESQNIPRKNHTHIYNGPIEIKDRTEKPNDLSEVITSYQMHQNRSWQQPLGNTFKGTTVRSKVYKPDNNYKYRSRIKTASYFIHAEGSTRYSLPILSITTNAENMFGFKKGIYIEGEQYFLAGGTETDFLRDAGNYRKKGRTWERPIHFVVFEKNGALSISQNVGLRIHGGGGRERFLKAFRLYGREDYDKNNAIKYAFFPGERIISKGYPLEVFHRVLFRQGGDWFNYLNDIVAHNIMQDSSVGLQRSRRFIHFINGEYWGIINARDRLDEYHIANKYNLNPDNIIILDSPYKEVHPYSEQLEAGDPEDVKLYNEFHEFALKKDLSKKDNYKHIKDMLCIESFIDYHIMFVYLNNYDWRGDKHFRYWRVREASDAPFADGKWRIMVWDFDFFRGDFENDWMISPMHHSRHNIFQNIIYNNDFRLHFINRFADHINTTFIPERIKDIVHLEYNKLLPELSEHIDRWHYNVSHPVHRSRWLNYAENRPTYQRQHIMKHFNITGEAAVTLDVSDNKKGHLRINTVEIKHGTPGVPDEPYPWSGIYFQGIPIEVEAISYPGYRFAGWEGVDSDEAEVTLELTGDIEITALFEEDTDDPKVEIPDDHLRYEIYQVLNKELHEPLLQSELALLKELDLRNYAVRDLDGLQYAVNLQELNIRDNGLTDELFTNLNLPLLADLEHLWYLNIRGNELTYLGETSPLRYLTQLEFLSIRDNDIEDISALAYLVNLKDLNARNNRIKDLAPLSDLENLRERLYLKGNPLVRSSYLPIEHYVDAIETTDFHIHMNPDPHILAEEDYRFNYWSSEEPELSFPDNMVFQQSAQEDPSLEAEMVRPYFLEPDDYHEDDEEYIGYPYRLTRRTRINGLHEYGVAFINTGWDRDLGAVVLALDTRDMEEADIYFTAGTVVSNDRIYAWRLQYRVGYDFNAPFIDIEIDNKPVEYVRRELAGHEDRFGPVSLPEDAVGEEYVQLRWKYYHVDITDGPRAQLRLDNIRVTAQTEEIQADFKASPTGGETPLHVEFTDHSIGRLSSWFWDFGDGAVSTGRNPVHVYTEPGTYTVTLTVGDQYQSETVTRENLILAFDDDTPQYDAQIISWELPERIPAGSTEEMKLTIRNMGRQVWEPEENVYLGAVGDHDDLAPSEYWRVGMSNDVEPGEKYTFTIPLQPQITGYYTTEWQMLKEGEFWFGEMFSEEVEVYQRTDADIWYFFE